MRNLLKAEWFKLSKSFGFKLLLLCNAASFITTIVLMTAVSTDRAGYQLFLVDLSYILHHSVIGYLFAAVFVSGEFSNRTFGMSILSGNSKRKIFAAKEIVFLAGFELLFLVYTLVSTITAILFNGFGLPFSFDSCLQIIELLLLGILGYAAVGAVMLFIVILTKKTIGTIGVGIAFTYALLWLDTTFRENPLSFIKYVYTYQIDQLMLWGEGFSVSMYVMVMVITFIVAIIGAGIVFEKSELK